MCALNLQIGPSFGPRRTTNVQATFWWPVSSLGSLPGLIRQDNRRPAPAAEHLNTPQTIMEGDKEEAADASYKYFHAAKDGKPKNYA